MVSVVFRQMHPISNYNTIKPQMKDEYSQKIDFNVSSWALPFNATLSLSNSVPASNQLSLYTYFPQTVYSYSSTGRNEYSTPNTHYHQLVGQNAGHYPIDAMFGSQNTYGGYNNSYGNAPYYAPPNEQFWGNKQNRVNYRNQDPAIASDSLYGYQNNAYSDQGLDGSLNHIESGISGLSIDQSKHLEDFGTSTFAGSLGSRKTTTWASIASQPAKSQPKSLKSKMAASGLTGSTSKHLPPTVTMDAMSWESKNGSMNNSASGGKSLPPPTVITTSVPPPPIAQSSISPIEDLPSPAIQTQQHSPPQRPPNQANKENSWVSNGNSSSSGSISTAASSPRPLQPPILSVNSMPKTNYIKGPINEIDEDYYPNKYVNQRNNNYSKPIDNQAYSSKSSAHSSAREVPDSPPPPGDASDDEAHPVLDKLCVENDYNPKEFDLAPRNARFFIIKSYSEDDVHRSIKYSIWCSTEHGNKRLDTAFRQQEDKGPIYLFYSVNRSGHFCGIAQMMSPVDYNASAGVWAQDKWKGQFQVKWVYVKDVPNDELRHITLENNENKPVTNSRDTQEVPYEKGKKVLSIIHNFDHRTSIFDDFLHYEKKQEEELEKKPSSPPPNAYPKPMSNSQYNSGMPPRDNQMPYRANANSFSKNRSYPDARDHREPRNDYRNEYRNDNRTEYRPERNDYRNDRMDRSAEYGRDQRERNPPEHRNEYRDNRDNREYRDYREPREPREPQFHRDQYHRDFVPPPPRDFTRERNDYRPPDRDHREFRERIDHRERNHHERPNQSWRN